MQQRIPNQRVTARYAGAALLLTTCNSLFGIHRGTARGMCADPLVIDDMEDGVGDICPSQGRKGHWFIADDGTGQISGGRAFAPSLVAPGERGAMSRYAAHFSGSRGGSWGAAMGFAFNDGLRATTYDTSAMGGVRFFMKSTVPVWVEFLTAATVLPAYGGTCSDANAANCNHHFSFAISRPGPGWQQYEVPYLALKQAGGTATWDPRSLLGLQFHVAGSGTEETRGAEFDVWIDDVAFYYCSTSDCLPTCSDPNLPVACPASDRSPFAYQPAACHPAGTDCADVPASCLDPLVIDDLEDGDAAICNSHGRYGSWYTFSDGTSTDLAPATGTTFAPALLPSAREGSRFAARLSGSGFERWGAAMGLTLAGGAKTYDASAFGGIRFWLKSTSPVTVSFPVRATTASTTGVGTCDESIESFNCSNHFHFGLGVVDSEWHEYAVPFAALHQVGRVDPNGNTVAGSATWNPRDISRLAFSVSTFGERFETWVDDVRLYSCSGDRCVPTCLDRALPMACPATSRVPASCWPAATDCADPPDAAFFRVWGSGRSDVWIGGSNRYGASGVLRHFDGSSWSRASADPGAPIWGIHGSSPTDAWAVGDHGTVLHFDGSTWGATNADTDASLNDVWSSGPDDTFAIASPSTLLHWEGMRWSQTKLVLGELWDLWGSGPEDVWAVGDAGAAAHWNGVTWSIVPTISDGSLYALWGSDANDVWAAGNRKNGDTLVLHWDGARWNPIGELPPLSPSALWGTGPSDVWLVGLSAGNESPILHFDGTSWTAVPDLGRLRLSGVWGIGANDIWAVGRDAALLHYDGNAWSLVHPGSDW